MTTSPSPAASDHTTQQRPVTAGTLLTAVLVPLMTVTGVVSSLHTEDIENNWAHRQQEACRHMPFPMSQYVAAWTGAALGVAAVVVCVLLAKRLRRLYGVRIWETKRGLLAYVGVWPCILTIPMELITLYATYSTAASGAVLGDCG